MTNMDKLYEAVAARGPVCVGLDTDFSYLPADFVDTTLTKGENIVRFNKKLIDATKAVAGCYKVLVRLMASAPAASTALHISGMFSAWGLSLTIRGFLQAARTIRTTSPAASAFTP